VPLLKELLLLVSSGTEGSSRIATATTCPITSTSFTGPTRIGSGEKGVWLQDHIAVFNCTPATRKLGARFEEVDGPFEFVVQGPPRTIRLRRSPICTIAPGVSSRYMVRSLFRDQTCCNPDATTYTSRAKKGTADAKARHTAIFR